MPAVSGLQGLQFDYQTPRTLSANLTAPVFITRTVVGASRYVFTQGGICRRALATRTVNQILPAGIDQALGNRLTRRRLALPRFRQAAATRQPMGDSIYHGLQTKLETAVLEWPDLPAHLHLVEDHVGRRRPAEWRH